MGDPDIRETCGQDLRWVECGACNGEGNEGEIDDQGQIILSSIYSCAACESKGGWWKCATCEPQAFGD